MGTLRDVGGSPNAGGINPGIKRQGVARMDEKKLIEGLNQDLADELGTVCCYIQQAATA